MLTRTLLLTPIAITLAVLASPPAALAAGGDATCTDCRVCEPFMKFATEYSLVSQVSMIGSLALHPQGHAFSQPLLLDPRIPEKCRSWVSARIPSPMLQLTARGSLSPAATVSATKDSSLANNVHRDLRRSFLPCDPAAADYTACLGKEGPTSYDRMSEWLGKLSPEALAAQLQSQGIGASVSDARLIKAYHEYTLLKNVQDMRAWAAGSKDKLSNEEFLSFILMVGGANNAQYDKSRTKGGPNSDGRVDATAMLAATRRNHVYDPNGNKDAEKAYGVDAGVCRDDAFMKAQLLEARGFKRTYIVGYRTRGGGHATIITQDPSDATKVYGVNWDSLSRRQGKDGSVALYQGHVAGIQDSGIKYRLYNPDGTLVDVVSSEAGKFLSEMAGFDARTMDPLARQTGSLLAVNLATPQGKSVQLQSRAGVGTDGNGSSYIAHGGTLSWDQNGSFPGKLGYVIALQKRPAAATGDPSGKDTTAAYAYVQAEQHARSRPIDLSRRVQLVVDTHATAAASIVTPIAGTGSPGGTASRVFNYDSIQRVGWEARVITTSEDRTRKLEVYAGAHAVPDKNLFDGVNITPSSVYLGAEGVLQRGDIALFGSALLVADQLGVRGRVEGGVASRSLAASAYLSGRLTDDTSMAQDQSLRRAGLALSYSPSRHVKVDATGEIPLEGDDPIKGMTVMSNLGLMY